jgi:preprotein translocase subunit SecE
MDKTNSKILTLSFAITAALIGFTLQLLIKIFAGAFGAVARMADSDFVRHGLPVLVGFGLFFLLQFNPRIRAWAEEVVTEIRKVVFPSRKDVTFMTISAIIMVAISTGIIWSFDLVSGYVLKLLMRG